MNSLGAEFSGLRIRAQAPKDLPALTDLVARSFAADRSWGERRNLTEIAIPALIVAGPRFEPELALVAEAEDGRILGYALWYPYRMSLRGRRVLAANLAPLAVDPEAQGRGIGSALMEASKVALEKAGVSLAFLCGHEGYYPRFGFKKNMFGKVGLVPKKPLIAAPPLSEGLEPGAQLRAPRPADEKRLRVLWEECLGESDLAIEPDPGFTPWMSFTPTTAAIALEREGEIAAYARFVNASAMGPFIPSSAPEAIELKLFLAKDAASALALLAALKGPRDTFVPLHPGSRAASRLFPHGYESIMETGPYAMALPLSGGSEADARAAKDYCEGVEKGAVEPGILLFPSVFDL
jgi:putative acetyltransferase